jgi:hypothetical protein
MSDSTTLTQSARIAALNDAFRLAGPNCDWVLTSGVHALGCAIVAAAVAKVRTHACFPPADDPHGERDFGAFAVDGIRLWFKIDYYDLELRYGAEDPADERTARRVITIMLPEDY